MSRSMKHSNFILRGFLDKALAGNFICIRGYASMSDLHAISTADETGYQRKLIDEHHDKMVKFLDDDKHLFFPEVILGVSLDGEQDAEEVDGFYKEFEEPKGSKHEFKNFRIDYSVTRYTSTDDTRNKKVLRRAKLTAKRALFENESIKFHRIDGNHRLSVLDDREKLGNELTDKFENLNVPYCLILFQTGDDLSRHSRALFHNLNFHQIPITKEKNLELILDDGSLFSDTDLKEQFGKRYLDARKVLETWNLEMIANIRAVIHPVGDTDKTVKRTYLVNLLELLEANEIIYNKGELLKCLGEINLLYAEKKLQKVSNHGLLTAFTYYALFDDGKKLNIFYNWVIKNHIYHTEDIKAEELIKVFDCVLESKERTIFVSMQFGDATDENYQAIKDAIEGVNKKHNIDIEIKPIRIDKEQKGHSYKIDDEILSVIEGCGLLIADLSLGNKNVYHEIGYLMGLNQGKSLPQNNILLVLNKGLDGANFDKDVGFNLKATQVTVAKDTNDLRTKLMEQIEIYYNISD